ncbi:hypothetical protein R3P38DRAFT_3210634 [Favolaschia claudopus]|uniref:Uncharacterized protein n=1 Tax=Favolaschia claudopus TaxID=2862362 RepID=A0AAW0AGD0_9AGAR
MSMNAKSKSQVKVAPPTYATLGFPLPVGVGRGAGRITTTISPSYPPRTTFVFQVRDDDVLVNELLDVQVNYLETLKSYFPAPVAKSEDLQTLASKIYNAIPSTTIARPLYPIATGAAAPFVMTHYSECVDIPPPSQITHRPQCRYIPQYRLQLETRGMCSGCHSVYDFGWQRDFHNVPPIVPPPLVHYDQRLDLEILMMILTIAKPKATAKFKERLDTVASVASTSSVANVRSTEVQPGLDVSSSPLNSPVIMTPARKKPTCRACGSPRKGHPIGRCPSTIKIGNQTIDAAQPSPSSTFVGSAAGSDSAGAAASDTETTDSPSNSELQLPSGPNVQNMRKLSLTTFHSTQEFIQNVFRMDFEGHSAVVVLPSQDLISFGNLFTLEGFPYLIAEGSMSAVVHIYFGTSLIAIKKAYYLERFPRENGALSTLISTCQPWDVVVFKSM